MKILLLFALFLLASCTSTRQEVYANPYQGSDTITITKQP